MPTLRDEIVDHPHLAAVSTEPWRIHAFHVSGESNIYAETRSVFRGKVKSLAPSFGHLPLGGLPVGNRHA